nr:hypothetical protein [Tanacetum cinerariifolium]
MTKPYLSPRFIANCFNAGYLKMVVKRRSVKVKELQERCIIKAFQVIKSRKDTAPGIYKAFVEELNEVETRRILTRHLKKVKFLELTGEKEYLAIARFFLEHENALEEMVFSWYKTDKGHKKSAEAMNEVLKFNMGTITSKMYDTAKGIVLNLIDLINTYGYVLNESIDRLLMIKSGTVVALRRLDKFLLVRKAVADLDLSDASIAQSEGTCKKYHLELEAGITIDALDHDVLAFFSGRGEK